MSTLEDAKRSWIDETIFSGETPVLFAVVVVVVVVVVSFDLDSSFFLS